MNTRHDISHLQVLFRQSTGIDLSHYKDDFFEKCLTSRMAAVNESAPDTYIRKALADARELDAFLQTFTVYHSRFMRDAHKYRVLREFVLPETMKRASAEGRPLRIWSAGCAAGEEPYSIAMSACEAFGEQEAQRQVTVLGTDIHLALLRKAASGAYSGIEFRAQEVDLYYLRKYFIAEGQTVTVREDIRRMVTFRRHDVVVDEAFAPMDIVFCRNVMIYLKLSAQRAILNAFYGSLEPEGFLFLGNAEMIDDEFYCHFRKVKKFGEFVYAKIPRDSDEFRERQRRQKSIRAGMGLK